MKTKAIVIESPGKASLREIELTEPGGDAVLCRTRMSAISSGTDMNTWLGKQSPEVVTYPVVPGYENAGEIIAVNSGSHDFSVGDRVMINECRKFKDIHSAWGGNVAVAVKDETTAFGCADALEKIPDEISMKEAVLAYLPCVSLKGVEMINFTGNEKVLVIGAGMIGISTLQLLRILYPGIRLISLERNAFRADIAKKYADCVIMNDQKALSRILEETDGGADVIIECSGNPEVIPHLREYLRDGGWTDEQPGGHIHLQAFYPGSVSLGEYHNWFTRNCTISMSCALKPDGKRKILDWIVAGRFDVKNLPVEIWPAAKCDEAFRHKEKMGDDVFKIIFDWEEVDG